MLRPAANLVHADTLQQCLCPRLALLAQAHATRSSSQNIRHSQRRSLQTSQPKSQNQPQRQSAPVKWSRSDVGDALDFLKPDPNRRRQPRIRPGSEDPRQRINVSSLRNDGTSYMEPPTLSAVNALPYNKGSRTQPRTSAQTVQEMAAPPPPVEEDHGDAINGNPPVTSKSNPVYAKYIRRMLDLANNGTASEVFEMAKFLATKGYAPTLDSYSCMIQACAKPEYGANMQEVALGILQEMKEEGIRPNSIIYHNLLKIFAHSPDYLRMEDILKEMMEEWIQITTEGWQYILQHWLVTGQVERAMEAFYERRSKGEKVHYNTYLEIIKALGRVNEVDEALRVMQEFQREWGSVGGNKGLPTIAWYELLNIAASNYHFEGVSYIWRKAVQAPPIGGSQPLLNPDDGLCLKVLNTAARHGSPKLALEVFRILSNRKVQFKEHYYAALIGAYAKSLDFPSAFRTLSLMRTEGVEPTATTANSITEALAANGKIEDVDSAYFILKDFAEKHEKVETAAFNAVLAACCKLGDLQRALGVYNECAMLKVSASTETFNILFAACVDCSQPPPKDVAMFLANEMKTIGLRPDAITYEELLRVSLYQEEDYEDAFMYLEEMKEVVPGGKVRPMVYEWIARRLEEKKDERLPMVVQEMRALGYDDYAANWEAVLAQAAETAEPQPAEPQPAT